MNEELKQGFQLWLSYKASQEKTYGDKAWSRIGGYKNSKRFKGLPANVRAFVAEYETTLEATNRPDMSKNPHIPKVLLAKVQRRMKGQGGEVKLEKEELDILLKHGVFALVSGEKNGAIEDDEGKDGKSKLTPEESKKRHDQLKDKLKAEGMMYCDGVGVYGGHPEGSVIVMVHDLSRKEAIDLGDEFKQNSIIYANQGLYELKFIHDPKETNNSVIGSFEQDTKFFNDERVGTTEFKQDHTGLTTKSGDKYGFRLGLDWDNPVNTKGWIAEKNKTIKELFLKKLNQGTA